MKLVFHLTVALGLWLGADAGCKKKGGCCTVCHEGWTELNMRCFKFIHDEKSWDDAENDCIKRGGNLASVHSDKDKKALQSLVKTSTGKDKPTWVGGYDAHVEGCWRWSDGTPYDYVFWGPGEPNNHKNKEHCMELNYGMDTDHTNDWFCNRKRSYLCVRKKDVVDVD